jgi:hypothetical protein
VLHTTVLGAVNPTI